MNFPENLRYTKDHEWIRIEGDQACVGITDYAQSQLGEIVYVDITSEGETIGQDEVFGTIEAVKTVSDLLMPLSGEILEVNPMLDDRPELVNQSPYQEGWLVKIKPSDIQDAETLFSAADYQLFINE